MDGHLSPAMVGTRWSGLLRGGNQCSDAGPGSALALARGQMVSHYMQVEPETTIMIYDAKISWDGGAVLYIDELTQGVLLPSNDMLDWGAVKEVCSGIGCMGMAALFLGLRCIAAMDVNPKVIEHLRGNLYEGALLGDINSIRDRYQLHITGGPTRGILMSGFPCQPLSSQGDGRGHHDARAQPLYSTLQLFFSRFN